MDQAWAGIVQQRPQTSADEPRGRLATDEEFVAAGWYKVTVPVDLTCVVRREPLDVEVHAGKLPFSTRQVQIGWRVTAQLQAGDSAPIEIPEGALGLLGIDVSLRDLDDHPIDDGTRSLLAFTFPEDVHEMHVLVPGSGEWDYWLKPGRYELLTLIGGKIARRQSVDARR